MYTLTHESYQASHGYIVRNSEGWEIGEITKHKNTGIVNFYSDSGDKFSLKDLETIIEFMKSLPEPESQK